MPDLRWGILGTGNIARQFCTGVLASRRCKLSAVGSRSPESAGEFASQFQIARAFGTYDALLRDDGVDAIYVSLPNHLHHEWTLKSLAAGKHVLCEKPIAMNAAEAIEMFDAAQRSGKILAEAFMYRSQPLALAVAESVSKGAIGQIRLIRTSFCYRTNRIEGNIRFRPEMGGGALMDIGCYCVNFSRWMIGGEPNSIQAMGRIHPTGVDEAAAGTMLFDGGVMASFVCGMTFHADNSAYICGTDGFIQIPIPWKPPARSIFIIARGTPPRMDDPRAKPVAPRPEVRTIESNGELYGIEADDFAATVMGGTPPRLTAADSIGNMKALDELRRQVLSQKFLATDGAQIDTDKCK